MLLFYFSCTGARQLNQMKIILQKVSRFLPSKFKLLSKLVLFRKYREIARLRLLPRYHATKSNILGTPIEIPDSTSFLEMYGEIFEQEMYCFRASSPTAYIIDGGANIGLSILYFKKIYPKSQIVGFEPDDEIFSILKRNVQKSGYKNIELICRALSSSETSLKFMAEGSYAGRIARDYDPQDKVVQSVRLRNYLHRRVDLLKLNIEGAETEVLEDCADLLGNVENIALEYHSFAEEQQTLHTVINILANVGFRLHVNPLRPCPQPLMYRDVLLGMDLQLYIFAFRS